MTFDFMAEQLALRLQQGLLRERKAVSTNKNGVIEIAAKHYINFASNDYLGLSQHEQVLQSYVEGLAMYGSGSGSSALVTGYSIEHEALENDLCEVLNKPAAILFSSGFAANQAICHALNAQSSHKAAVPQSRIVCDKYMHASFIQGALESAADLTRFKHNDMAHAQHHINQSNSDTLIATEGVFSMDGDLGDVAGLQAIMQQQHYSAKQRPWLMVDDAHGIGVMGKHGFGTLDLNGVNADQVDIVMGTFGKALGTSGAFVAGTYNFIEYLANFSKHYVYSTAFCAAQARATRASIALVAAGEEREKLHTNIALFTHLSKLAGLPLLPSESAIQPLIVGNPHAALTMSQQLSDLGLWIPAIRTPTVPVNSDRLRITLSALHTEKDIRALVDGLCMTYSTCVDKADKPPHEHLKQ